MPASLLLRWCAGVTASVASDGAVLVEGTRARLTLRPAAPAVRAALLRFAPPGAEEERLAEHIADDRGGLARWYYYLERLNRRGLLSYAVYADGACLATLVPLSPGLTMAPARPVAGRRFVLSRFAYLHREGHEAVLDSPLAHARLVLTDARATALVGCLAAPAEVAELVARLPGLAADALAATLSLLARAGLAQEVGSTGVTAEDDDPALRSWEFHDLLFHGRSRRGRSDAPYGATYRLAGQVAPPPALKPVPAGEVHELYRPEPGQPGRADPPFTHVLEQRRSVRHLDSERPITDRQLGEFLFRVARVRDRRAIEVTTPHGPVCLDMAARPYPAGGGLYELELYLAVNRCANLRFGLYYYEPLGHRLIRLAAPAAEVTGLLGDAGSSTGIPHAELQVLIILAARFGRLAWKYESLAYALTLKHVGVLYQTMYLTATALGLAPCAVGGGDADRFARAAGTDYAAETSVGEFLLGSVRPGTPGGDGAVVGSARAASSRPLIGSADGTRPVSQSRR